MLCGWEGNPQAWRKVMAAYRQMDDLVACGPTACTLGSAPGPTLGNSMASLYHCYMSQPEGNVGDPTAECTSTINTSLHARSKIQVIT